MINSTTCSCVSPFTWNPFRATCDLNCRLVTNSVGCSNTASQCSCTFKYVWNATNNLCVLNCASVTYAIRTIPAQNGACTCQSGFQWVPSLLDCQIVCSNILNSLGTFVKINECRCKPNTVWNLSLRQCVLNCLTIPNSDGRPSTNGSVCGCKIGFTWASTSMSCV